MTAIHWPIGHAKPVLGRASRARWLARRRKGLGASDVAAVLGFSNYSTPVDVWLEKTGRREPDDLTGDYAVQRGNYLEPLLLATYFRDHPDRVRLKPPALLAHPDHPMLLASLDGVGHDGLGLFPIEAKTAGWRAREDWWDDTKQIPDAYAVQVLTQLAVTGLSCAVVIADVAGDLRELTIERDLDWEAVALPQLEAWWQRHVVGDEPPDPDPIRDYPNLSRLWIPTPKLEWEASSEALLNLAIYRNARDEAAFHKQRMDEARGLIRIAAHEATVITHDGETVATVSTNGALKVK